MRITFILPGYPWGPVGGFRVVYQYANELVALGHDVAVVHARYIAGLGGTTWRGGVRRLLGRVRDAWLEPTIWWQPIDPRVELHYVREPVPEAVPEGDVVFATAWQTARYVLDLPPSRGAKFYLVQDFAPWLGSAEAIGETWRWPLTKVAISTWIRDAVVAAGGADVVTIPNGIDRPSLALRSPIAGRPRRVAMMYSGAPYKGVADGVEALVRAKRAVPQMEAVLFGSPRRPRWLPGWIRYERNLPDDALVDLYNGTAVFLCSSTAEGFALPPAEAMACGCAVATTDCGGNREYAEDGVTALISEPEEPGALAENLVRLLRDDTLRIRLAEAGQERIRGFAWSRSARRLEACLMERVGGALTRS